MLKTSLSIRELACTSTLSFVWDTRHNCVTTQAQTGAAAVCRSQSQFSVSLSVQFSVQYLPNNLLLTYTLDVIFETRITLRNRESLLSLNRKNYRTLVIVIVTDIDIVMIVHTDPTFYFCMFDSTLIIIIFSLPEMLDCPSRHCNLAPDCALKGNRRNNIISIYSY